MFLTPDQLKDLTGYQRGADQAKWLKKRGYPFAMNRKGRPKVLSESKPMFLERQPGIDTDGLLSKCEILKRSKAIQNIIGFTF